MAPRGRERLEGSWGQGLQPDQRSGPGHNLGHLPSRDPSDPGVGPSAGSRGAVAGPPPSALSANGPSPRRWHSTRPLGRVLGPTQAQEGLRTCVAAAACAARTPRTSLVPPAATLPGLWMWKCLDEMLGAMAAAGGLGEWPLRLQERVCPAGADGDGWDCSSRLQAKLGCSCQEPRHVLGLGPIHSGPRGKQLCLLGHRLRG